MDLAAKAVIANVPAIDPAAAQSGPVIGFVAAEAISNALDKADYVVIRRDDLQKIEDMAKTVLTLLKM